MKIDKETALYLPVKEFLEGRGFEVKGEVRGCDLVGVCGQEIVVVELKRTFNLTLIFQGMERQKLTDDVYLAIEAPKKRRGHDWTATQNLCRRLGLGLLTVNFTYTPPKVEIVVDLTPYVPRKNARKKGLLIKEFGRRSGDFNVGGSTRRPIVTAYREEALQIARYLEQHGPSSTRILAQVTGNSKVASILQKNFYGWFLRVKRGEYTLTPEGEKALDKYAYVFWQSDGQLELATGTVSELEK